MKRYEIHTGKFGQYFYDTAEDRDLPLAAVLALINGSPVLAGRVDVAAGVIAELRAEVARLTYKCNGYESLEHVAQGFGYSNIASALEADNGIDGLRAEVERLTEERDAYWQALMRIRSDDENAGITAQVVLAMYAGERSHGQGQEVTT